MKMLSIIENTELKTDFDNFILSNGVNEEDVICAMTYKFAKKLPYSMDYKDEDYVPGDFLNFTSSIKRNSIFKYHNNIYSKMVDWSDSFKSGILLQICLIFQKMLMNEFPNDYILSEEDYYNWEINNMTSNETYNHCFFEILKELPDYYKKVNDAWDQTGRREILDEIYQNIKNKIGQKVGGYKKTEVDGNIEKVTESPATVNMAPYRDLEMVYYFANIDCYDTNCSPLIDDLKNRLNHVKKPKELTKKY